MPLCPKGVSVAGAELVPAESELAFVPEWLSIVASDTNRPTTTTTKRLSVRILEGVKKSQQIPGNSTPYPATTYSVFFRISVGLTGEGNSAVDEFEMADAQFDLGLGFEGSHVLVTGSSGAIGSVVVKAFLAAGAFVTAFDIAEPREPVDHERLHSACVDITDESGLERAMEIARGKYGVITTCVLAAGLDLSYCAQHSLADMPLKDWQRILNVNLDGTFLTCRAWLQGIRKHATAQSRNIAAVLFGSEAGSFGVSTCAPYAASKAAIQVGLVKSVARDAVTINPRCRVNAVAPGPVATKQFLKECEDDPAALWREAQATVALRQPVSIDAVARACLFLASDNFASNITGQVLPVDCGKNGTLMWLAGGERA